MKVTLPINGREITFSEEELISILEKHFSSEATNRAKTEEVSEKPTEGECFKVNPLAIDQNLFKKKRSDLRQEETRQLILGAFRKMKKNPRYSKPFKTMMIEATWETKTVGELKELASEIGDHNADWVEQALEWAQRIANGETWESICNEPDTANWHREVLWKDGEYRRVGGSRVNKIGDCASFIEHLGYCDGDLIVCTVPLVVLYE